MPDKSQTETTESGGWARTSRGSKLHYFKSEDLQKSNPNSACGFGYVSPDAVLHGEIPEGESACKNCLTFSGAVPHWRTVRKTEASKPNERGEWTTSNPYFADRTRIYGENNRFVGSVNEKEDALRIVACVNACRGISSEDLARGVVPMGEAMAAINAVGAMVNEKGEAV